MYNLEAVQNVISTLKGIDIDGETMQYILKEVGMEEQMLRQLVMTSNANALEEVISEWQTCYGEELEIQ
jgi:hypothetical protein